jgi:predicted  nucleic acid-binding Zn-ribbon protein
VTAPLIHEINTILAAPPPPTAARTSELSRIERTLTDGYAHALALEAERCRLDRRIREAAADLGGDEDVVTADEISALAHRLASADGDLARLRELLSELRRRAQALR